jgi:hypothetical protein
MDVSTQFTSSGVPISYDRTAVRTIPLAEHLVPNTHLHILRLTYIGRDLEGDTTALVRFLDLVKFSFPHLRQAIWIGPYFPPLGALSSSRALAQKMITRREWSPETTGAPLIQFLATASDALERPSAGELAECLHEFIEEGRIHIGVLTDRTLRSW